MEVNSLRLWFIGALTVGLFAIPTYDWLTTGTLDIGALLKAGVWLAGMFIAWYFIARIERKASKPHTNNARDGREAAD